MEFMYRMLIVAIFVISTVPLCAQSQQPDTAKLKADAQKVVSIIKDDKTKIVIFCQIEILSKAIDEAIQEKDSNKAGELTERISAGEKQLGPEYIALADALRNIDLTSKDGQEIISPFDTLACRN